MTQLQQTHRAELQQKDIQHMRAVHRIEERQRQREEEVREELQQKEVLLQQKNSDISRLQSKIDILQVGALRAYGSHIPYSVAIIIVFCTVIFVSWTRAMLLH